MLQEYFVLAETVLKFDEQLITIKSWGVTFGLATLVVAFKENSSQLFGLAAIAGLCFWIIEGETKFHQTNHYYRMNEIERHCHNNTLVTTGDYSNCPKIDWSWRCAYSNAACWVDDQVQKVEELKIKKRYQVYIMPHVMFPNIVVIVIGLVFFSKIE